MDEEVASVFCPRCDKSYSARRKYYAMRVLTDHIRRAHIEVLDQWLDEEDPK